MIGIPFDLGRMKFVRLDEHSGGDAANRESRREEHRLAGYQILRLPDIWNDRLLRLTACRKSCSSDGRSHQLDEVAPVDAIAEGHRLTRELFLEKFVERIAARELLEAPPIFAAAKIADAFAELLEVEFFLAHLFSGSQCAARSAQTRFGDEPRAAHCNLLASNGMSNNS